MSCMFNISPLIWYIHTEDADLNKPDNLFFNLKMGIAQIIKYLSFQFMKYSIRLNGKRENTDDHSGYAQV